MNVRNNCGFCLWNYALFFSWFVNDDDDVAVSACMMPGVTDAGKLTSHLTIVKLITHADGSWSTSVILSVCLSVCPHDKPTNEYYVKRSKVKVTGSKMPKIYLRRLNQNVWKYNHQTWHRDGASEYLAHQRIFRQKVKDQGHKFTKCITSRRDSRALLSLCGCVVARWETVSKNCHLFVFFKNNSVKRGPISIICGIRSPEETLHQKVVNLSTSPEICHRTTLWNAELVFTDCL